MKNLLTCLFLAAAVGVSAQGREINVGSFDEVYFGVPGTLYITQGNTNKVVVDASDENWERLEIEVDGSRLKIKNKNYKNWSWKNWEKGEMTFHVTMKDIEGISVGGSGKVISKNKLKVDDIDLSVSGSGNMELDMDAEDTDISVSGSGKIYLDGTADEVEVSISGSGKIKAENFEVNVCDVSISGSGTCYITANKEIDARISGSGSVYYNGNPDRVSSRSSGSGKVKKI